MSVKATYFWSAAILVVYGLGMFLPLMENDSAQFAAMAASMALENDFTHLFKAGQPYLDKPHMHYWLAALSMKFLGLNPFAYRLPSVLFLILGAFYTYKTGTLLGNASTGRTSALIFVFTQTILLSGFDVRTDAVLTSFIAISLFYCVRYVKQQRLFDLSLGALFVGFAFATKGLIAVVILGVVILSMLISERKIQLLFSLKMLWALALFLIAVSPVLLAYYQQFDLHPELEIRGIGNRKGWKFLFWEQSFERMSGTGYGRTTSDPFFFFHTFLWAFAPLSLVGLYRLVRLYSISRSLSTRIRPVRFFGWSLLILLSLMSLAQFKLPHYINALMPLSALFFAPVLDKEIVKNSSSWMSKFTYLIFWMVSLLLSYSFYQSAVVIVVGVFGFTVLLVLQLRKLADLSWLFSASLFLNAVAYLVFYPKLLSYQSDLTFVDRFNFQNNSVYNATDSHTWNLDFYTHKHIEERSVEELFLLSDSYAIVSEKNYRALKGLRPYIEEVAAAPHYRVTKLSFDFLNPGSRLSTVEIRRLVRLP